MKDEREVKELRQFILWRACFLWAMTSAYSVESTDVSSPKAEAYAILVTT